MKKIIKPKINKKCNVCGQSHFEIPKDARPQYGLYEPKKVIGVFFECACLSSLFVRLENENVSS